MNQPTQKESNFNYIECVNISVARKIMDLMFDDNLVKVVKNHVTKTYDVYLNKIDDHTKETIEYFNGKMNKTKGYRFFATEQIK